MKKSQKIHAKNSPQKKFSSTGSSTFFYILIRSWNAFDCFDRCIDSVFSQTYDNYQIIFIDDASDYSIEQKKYIREKLKGHIVILNRKRKYALCNAYEALNTYAKQPDAVVISLDGDDWLASNDSLATLNEVYIVQKPQITYGDCLIYDGTKISNKPASQLMEYTNIKYPEEVRRKKLFWRYPFLPLHPLTWKVRLFREVPKKYFMHKGKWFKYWQDLAIFLVLLERAPTKISVINKPLVVYNTAHPTNTNKGYSYCEKMSEEIIIRKKLKSGIALKNSNDPRHTLSLSFSRLLSIPIFNSFIYYIQFLLLKMNILTKIHLSKKNNHVRDILLDYMNRAPCALELTDYRLGSLLFRYYQPIHANFFISPYALNRFGQKEWYDLMWSLVISDTISKKMKLTLSPYIHVDCVQTNNPL